MFDQFLNLLESDPLVTSIYLILFAHTVFLCIYNQKLKSQIDEKKWKTQEYMKELIEKNLSLGNRLEQIQKDIDILQPIASASKIKIQKLMTNVTDLTQTNQNLLIQNNQLSSQLEQKMISNPVPKDLENSTTEDSTTDVICTDVKI